MISLSGLKQISNSYSHFILDVWGVLHDGIKAYPGVVETLDFLRKDGKKICMLSNAPRRATKVVEMLKNFGITPNFYDFILTSGEAAFLDLKKNQEENFKNFGKNYFYIGPKKDIDLLDGLDYVRVAEASKANFVITTGFNGESSTLAEKLPEIIAAKENNLPMICVNPDLIVVRQNGDEMLCAGVIAHEYAKMSGEVFYYGKPFSAVYKIAHQLCENPQKNKILAIGDGLETDIKGANDFGIDSLLITGGILANQLGVKYWQDADEKKLEKICQEYRTFPKFIISNLKI